MNATSRSRAPAAISLVLLATSVVFAGCDTKSPSEATAGITDANIAQKVEQARTPADHHELAAYYEARARVAQRESADERALGGHYERRWQSDAHPMGSGARHHFEGLAEQHESGANHYRAMAEWHRQMAERTRAASEGGE